ncbi:hypothetical protein [Dechloromonas sp. H13]|uniref:hypothetical protein n=1 Tax=Dechloromonas sp. H13 TaxID=2570193 RepID=UPI00129255B8|nr:hypothetical protein [Dechloromonas sp. H13]
MYHHFENYVKVAVDRAGGVTKASNVLGVANQTISTWIKKRRVSNIVYASKLAELSGLEIQQLRSTR